MLRTLLGQPPTGGFELCATLEAASGRRCTPYRLLPVLLALEDAGHVLADRSGEPHLYCLTARGTEAAYAAGAAHPEPTLLVMADLVGFTAFTEQHGDAAAHEQASRFTHLARDLARSADGKLVKALGDGVLLGLPTSADPLRLLRRLSRDLAGTEPAWRLHAGAHVGCPIRHAGDVYGRDVNLVARLCAHAAAGEVLVTAPDGEEQLALEGVPEPARVRRIALSEVERG